MKSTSKGTNKGTTHSPAATADATRLVALIAGLQEERAEVLARLAAQVGALDASIAHATDALSCEVRTARTAPVDLAAIVKAALVTHRVNTGQLCSRFCDAMERRGAAIYPPTYQPITNAWDVTPACHTL